MRNTFELISVATEKTAAGKPLGWWTFGEPGVFIRSLSPEDVASDKRLDDFCYFLCSAFKIVLQEGLTVDFEKSQVLACLVKSRSRKNNNASCFLGSILGR